MAISDQQIFDWFLSNPGADDATIASTMDQFSLNPADIARVTGTDVGDVQYRYDAVQPSGGLSSIDSSTTNNTYFNANPDVAAAYTGNTYGMTPQQFADFHYTTYGVNEGRASSTPTPVPTPVPTPAYTPVDTSVDTPVPTPVETTTATFGGQNYTLNNADVNNVYNQIVGQGTMGRWTGEGFGSADANARAMAQNLVASGVTDISQIGQKTVTNPGYYTSMGRFGQAANLKA